MMLSRSMMASASIASLINEEFPTMDPVRALSVAVIAVPALALAACGNDPIGLDGDGSVNAFVTLVNAHRVDVGCEPFVWRADVAAVAQAHSQDMSDRGFFGHTNPEGYSPFDRLQAAGITFSLAAENIAFGHTDAASVLQAWLDSPGHRSNIENCNLQTHGVGSAGTHWTHLFVTP